MTWTLLLAVACVALVIAIAVGRQRKSGWFNKGSIVALIVVFFAAGNVINIQYHKAQDRENETQLETGLQNTRLWPVIQEHEPDLAANLRTQMLELVKKGVEEQRALKMIETEIFALKRQRLQFAPDDSVLAWMHEMLEDNTCLSQQGSGGSGQTTDAEFAMIRASWGPDKHSITREERQNAERDMESLALTMVEKYGDDVQLLAQPEKAQGKRALYCAMSRDFLNTMLELPPSRAAGLFRLSMTEESP